MISRAIKNILIPADFSVIPEDVIKNVISLVEPFNSIIHLFSIAKVSSLQSVHLKNTFNVPGEREQPEKNPEAKLEELRENMLKRFPNLQINAELTTGKKNQTAIEDKANELHAELIVIIKNTSAKWFPFSNSINATLVAKETNSAVLVVNSKAIPEKIKSIVLPVRSCVPERNIELLSTFTRKQKATVHLAAMYNNGKPYKTSTFIDTYRALSDFVHFSVDYKVLDEKNFLKAVLNYGKNVTADLIFVNPFEEPKANFQDIDISNLITNSSTFCVLITEPIHRN